MSLGGVRDMSTMETPPEDRLPITTYIAEYDERIIREAIVREIERNGQVFFVHNRVQTIDLVANKIRSIVPEARVVTGHGQMNEDQLEKATSAFLQGKYDVFVCTTIIESGLDMPNVNTLIVNQADRFGLTQLYQLRGRVGRGATLAYAYFLFDKGKRITPIAEKRLRTIHEATELGAGFNIAMRDLEIRGAGTLLGIHQSGQISAVGFNLYSQMLAKAIESLKEKKAGLPPAQVEKKLPSTSIDMPIAALIPSEYVDDVITRLELYQRLADMTDTRQTQPFARELADRFGPPPEEVENLLNIVKLKAMGTAAHVESISAENGDIVLRLFEGLRFDQLKLRALSRYGITSTGSLGRFSMKQSKGWKAALEDILKVLAVI
jgi:transcription-repair coupling factor (superfamily II helicase)